jgi:hypothetical protein
MIAEMLGCAISFLSHFHASTTRLVGSGIGWLLQRGCLLVMLLELVFKVAIVNVFILLLILNLSLVV